MTFSAAIQAGLWMIVPLVVLIASEERVLFQLQSADRWFKKKPRRPGQGFMNVLIWNVVVRLFPTRPQPQSVYG